jgi:hypothetical protein
MTAGSMPPTIDPDNIPETLCAGKLNVSFASGGFGTLTFTHPRPKIGPLLDAGQIVEESVVRARIVLPNDNLVALRDLLNSAIKDQPVTDAAPVSGGANKLN